MDTIYLNNFRGFNNSFVELAEINFFVGENSTGKTSVLKVIKAFSDNDFWLNKNMDLNIINLGYFHEIASDIQGDKKSFFEIGYYDYQSKSFIKLVYIEKKGLPSLSEIFIRNEKIKLQFNLGVTGELKYRFKNTESNEGDFQINAEEFKEWVKTNDLNTEKFHKSKRRGINFPLYFEMIMVMEEKLEDSSIDIIKPLGISPEMYWSAPIRSQPKRIYDNPISMYNPDGSHAPFLLRDILQSSSDESSKKKTRKVEKIISRFGTDSGLFEGVSIKQLSDSVTSPFQIHIKISGRSLNFTNVGYGVSQILPLLVEIITRKEGALFAIQQPEVHLHPKGQAAFGDFIFKSNIKEKKQFIIETHSDYLIDRFRIRRHNNYTQNKEKLAKSQVVFFSKTADGNLMRTIKIEDNGKFESNIPDAYREFFIKEQFKLLEI